MKIYNPYPLPSSLSAFPSFNHRLNIQWRFQAPSPKPQLILSTSPFSKENCLPSFPDSFLSSVTQSISSIFSELHESSSLLPEPFSLTFPDSSDAAVEFSSSITASEPVQYVEFDEATQQLLEKAFSESLRIWMGLTFLQSLEVDLAELPGTFVPILFDSHFAADSNVLVAPFLGFGRTSGRDFWVQRGFLDENGVWEESWVSGRFEAAQQWGPRTKKLFCGMAAEERLEGLLERRDSGYNDILHMENQEKKEEIGEGDGIFYGCNDEKLYNCKFAFLKN